VPDAISTWDKAVQVCYLLQKRQHFTASADKRKMQYYEVSECYGNLRHVKNWENGRVSFIAFLLLKLYRDLFLFGLRLGVIYVRQECDQQILLYELDYSFVESIYFDNKLTSYGKKQEGPELVAHRV
jgi:hypothetical protein